MAGAKQKQVDKLPIGRPFRKSYAAKLLGVSRPTIDRMIRDGRLELVIIADIYLVQRNGKV